MALMVMIPALALLFLGHTVRPPAVEAKPSAIVTFNWTLCFMLTVSEDWNDDGIVDGADSTKAFFDCTNLDQENVFRGLVRVLGGDPDDPKPSDFAAIDQEAGQLHEKDGSLWVVAFVGNDQSVAFYADEGQFAPSGSANVACGKLPSPDYDFEDEDCNNDGTRGDGAVVVKLNPADADRGPATLRVRQGTIEISEPYVVTGEPWNIELTPSKTAIQSGAVLCEMFSGTTDYLATLGNPAKTPVTAIVTDDDDTVLTHAIVQFTVDDADLAQMAVPAVPALASPLGIGSPDVLCGGEGSGTVTLTATISTEAAEGIVVNPSARTRHAEAEIAIEEPPTNMALSASPTSLVCDGTATSAVSAALTDAEGNPAIDGNVVRFSVKALGTISPIESKSAGGAATTTLTPLTDIARGVTMGAVLMGPKLIIHYDDLTEQDIANCEEEIQSAPCPVPEEVLVPTNIERAFLVECSAATTQPAPGTVPGAPSGPTISPPSTGNGGYLVD